MARVDRDQTTAGRVEIGLNPEDRAIVVDELILGVEVIEQFYDL